MTRALRGGSISRDRPAAVAEADNWPHTRRPLPWLLAGFLVMIFLVPFDAIIFKVHMPANATLDRVLLVVMIAVFLASRAVNGRNGPRRRLTPVEIAMLVFGGIALLSIVLNIDRIYQQNELSFVNKQFSQLLAYGAFFFIVVATHPPRGGAGLHAPGDGPRLHHRGGRHLRVTNRQQRVLRVVGDAAGPICDRRPATDRTSSKLIISGPAQHGLALASMLTIALPFAVLPLLEARRSERTVEVPPGDRPDPGRRPVDQREDGDLCPDRGVHCARGLQARRSFGGRRWPSSS